MPYRAPTIDQLSRGDARFASRYRSAGLGPVAIGEVEFLRDASMRCDDVGSAYYVYLPLSGGFTARHRGVRVAGSRAAAAVLRPEGGAFQGWWTKDSSALCVRFAPAAVEEGLARLLGGRTPSRIPVEPVMRTDGGAGRSWADLVLMVNRQRDAPGTLLAQPLVSAPLAESLLNGFLLAAAHADSGLLAAPAGAARPAAVRTAVDLIEADPRAPLTVALLAEKCGVGVRALQEGFRRHLGMSPMAYARAVRLRCAHEDLRAADPAAETVAAVARRWGFGHLGRFAAAHEERYGQTPAAALRAPR